MPIPTITSITPNTGRTSGGNVVRIIGANFRLPPVPPATGYLGGAAQQTVAVKFEGVRAPWAEAASATLALARVPEWAGDYVAIPMPLDVRLANLADDGSEIPTEFVLKLDAYTISRPSLVEEGVLQKVIRVLISVFRRHLLENTSVVTSRDFDDDPTSLQRALAELPVVHLIGPSTQRNNLRQIHRVEEAVYAGDEYQRSDAPMAVDVSFQLRAYTQGIQHMLALQQALVMLFRDVSYLSAAGQTLEFRMPFTGYPTSVTVPNMSDIYSIFAQILINGVQLDYESASIVERGWKITANDGMPILDTQKIGV
jgi:hypothetical protein